MLQRHQASIALSAQSQRLDRLRTIAEGEHLLPRERDSDRALQSKGG
jgi:hypothetical protein